MTHETEVCEELRPLGDASELTIWASLVGKRINFSKLPPIGKIARFPLLVRTDEGAVAIFRCGVLVFFNCAPRQQSEFVKLIRPAIELPSGFDETETLTAIVDTNVAEDVDGNLVFLRDFSAPKLQLIAEAMCRSMVLSEYEAELSQVFDGVEPLAHALKTTGKTSHSVEQLLKHIGDALTSELRLVGRAGITDKPELLWERPELEPLYQKLIDEFEIDDRHAILERKISIVSNTARTALDLYQTNQGHRLEWYIILLIMIEIVLLLYDLFLAG